MQIKIKEDTPHNERVRIESTIRKHYGWNYSNPEDGVFVVSGEKKIDFGALQNYIIPAGIAVGTQASVEASAVVSPAKKVQKS